MRHRLTLATGLLAASWAVSAAAPPPAPATTVTTQMHATAPTLEPPRPPAPRLPQFNLLGAPVQTKIYAPVPAPYGGSAYRDLGGQPESGQDAVMQQSSPQTIPVP